MKLKHLMMASALCLTLSAPSAFACEHGSGWFFSFFHHCDDHDKDKGQDHGQNSGGHDHDGGGHQCNGGGGHSGGGSGGGAGTK